MGSQFQVHICTGQFAIDKIQSLVVTTAHCPLLLPSQNIDLEGSPKARLDPPKSRAPNESSQATRVYIHSPNRDFVIGLMGVGSREMCLESSWYTLVSSLCNYHQNETKQSGGYPTQPNDQLVAFGRPCIVQAFQLFCFRFHGPVACCHA